MNAKVSGWHLRAKSLRFDDGELTSNIKTNIIRLQISVDNVIAMQVAKRCSDIKGNMNSFGEKSPLFPIHINSALKISPVIDLMLERALQSVQ